MQLPYAVFAFNPVLRRLPGKIGEDGACLMTSAIFSIPLLRHVYSWVKGLPVDKRTFLGRLHKGESFAFTPGGVQEVFALDPKKPDDVVLYLKRRKGFIKLALTTGSPVVPVFGFNLDGSYGYYFPRGRLVELLSRQLGMVPLLFWGRWGIPYGIPNPQKIHVVIGQGEWMCVETCLCFPFLNEMKLLPVVLLLFTTQPSTCPKREKMSRRKVSTNITHCL